MVKKNKPKKSGEALGISGFTLGIVSIVIGIFMPIFGVATAIVGFSLSRAQQKINPTNYGKKGIILNLIGFVLSIFWWILVVKYLLPILQEQLKNSLI